jgi:hypothetical protein
MSSFYHEGSRQLQDEFQSRKIADRLEQVTRRKTFTEDDRAFIESRVFFFLATADAEGRPDCNHKGGIAGFVRVVASDEIAFPDYDGNGLASVSRHDPLLTQTVGAQLIVRVKAQSIFPNCPRYIPKMRLVEPSSYAPRAGVEVSEPAWKSFPEFKDAVHPRQKTFKGDLS